MKLCFYDTQAHSSSWDIHKNHIFSGVICSIHANSLYQSGKQTSLILIFHTLSIKFSLVGACREALECTSNTSFKTSRHVSPSLQHGHCGCGRLAFYLFGFSFSRLSGDWMDQCHYWQAVGERAPPQALLPQQAWGLVPSICIPFVVDSLPWWPFCLESLFASL